MEKSPHCIVCGSKETKVFYQEKQEYEVLRCQECKLVFNYPQDLQKEIESIYKKEYYFSPNATFGYEDYMGEKSNIQRTFSERMDVIKRFMPRGQLLDVGCALGYFLEVASGEGYTVRGIDVSSWASQYARQNYDFEIITGKLEDCDELEENTFDVITLWDVMEQVPHPKKFMNKVSRLLKQGGYLFLTIRDIDSFISRALKKGWIHFRPSEKYVYFNDSSIRNLLSDENFSVELITYRGMGKACTLRTLCHKASHYNRWISTQLERLCAGLHIQKVPVYINFYDSKLIAAKKNG